MPAAETPLTLGIDIGGTAIKAGLLTREGELVAETEFPTPVALPPAKAIDGLARDLGRFVAGRSVAAVGIGCAGLVSSREGVVHLSPNLPRWRDAPLGPLIAGKLGLPVFVLNDANAFALAEARAGAGRGASPVVALTLGTGVGGALVIGGRLASGFHGFGGEVGHMSIDRNGPPCPCGNRGCLELFVGRRGLMADFFDQVAWRSGEPAYDSVGGDRDALTPKMLCAAAQRGDPAARLAFARAGEALGIGLVNLSNLLDPERFVIGGGIAQAGELLLGSARAILRERAIIGPERVASLRAAALGLGAGVIGAALFAGDSLAAEGETVCPPDA
ncbi:MAG: ROK family protein [Candidatus Eisenbacteria sp.]|nr:ROK family protein [Candidatus Eisenbacteria bacterium]